ncbi:hypothetical protein CISIN_1g043777mg [Citrus sinensis]|uniref:NmrA-like domain-containing protein n=1 Tax=Citrus sinensis TaxID=2711 RepID=A0A067DYL2_CITSI|nr:hypothetical protein CISIN_1g043777mg [Citrus sinensis]
MAGKSNVLVIGAIGRIGYHFTRRSIEYGHPKFALIRDSASNFNFSLLRVFHSGVFDYWGLLEDEKSLLEAVKQVDVRFIPSEYGAGVFVKDTDVAAFTINALDDPRTLNKLLHLREISHTFNMESSGELDGTKLYPHLKYTTISDYLDTSVPRGNIYSFNDLVSLWEEKIGKALDRVYVAEDQLLKNIQEKARVLGDQTNFEIEPSFGVEATELYPDVNYTTVDEYLNQFI